jgi:hypothetical protein
MDFDGLCGAEGFNVLQSVEQNIQARVGLVSQRRSTQQNH